MHSWIRSHPTLYQAARRLIMGWRRVRYRLNHVHPTFYLAATARVSRDLVAGAYSYIGPDCSIGPKVTLGPYAMIGPRVCIIGGDHRFDRPGTPIIFSGRPFLEPTIIESDAWIGCGAILIAGVRIGRGAIVAAGSVVSREVPPYEIHGGVPARKIKNRFDSDEERAIHDAMLQGHPRAGTYCKELSIA